VLTPARGGGFLSTVQCLLSAQAPPPPHPEPIGAFLAVLLQDVCVKVWVSSVSRDYASTVSVLHCWTSCSPSFLVNL
jgi:hypothetical protein